jgi:DNA primase
MINISKKLKRYIRKEFDYQEYIELNCSYQPTNSGELRICCPWCGESDYKCYVNNDKKFFNCFKCESSNRNKDVFDFVAEIENISVIDAIEKLVQQFREITPEELSEYAEEYEELLETIPSFNKIRSIEGMPEDATRITGEDQDSAPFINYMYSRGFTLQDILDCQMYCVTPTVSLVRKNGKRYGNIGRRIIWPVYGGNTQLVSWVARDITGHQEPKYLNCPDADLAKTVWPFVPPAGNTIVVVEGIIDAFAIRKAGYSSYATFGKKLSLEQIELFKHWEVQNIILFLDHNAKKEMIKLVDQLRLVFKDIFVIDVSNWPKNLDGDIKDSGSMLAFPNGMAIIQESINNKINIKQELDYLKWSIT